MDFTSLAFSVLLLIFIIGLVLILKGGDAFVDAASWMARRFGIPPFLIGATIVSVATTLPELLVSLFATQYGSADLAVGNAIGSVTANTGLILAISLLAMPSDAPRNTFCTKGILLLSSITTLFWATHSGVLNHAGQVILLLLFLVFLLENIHAARQPSARSASPTPATLSTTSPHASTASDTPPTPVQHTDSAQSATLAQNTVLFLLGAFAIAAGSQLLVSSATELAVRLQVPEAVIAVTIVAVGTALPELVTTLTAIAKKEAGLSAGNILGANIIDTALILPLCSLLNGSSITINAQSLVYDIPACLLCISIAVLPTLFTQKLQRWQGAAILATYLAYLAMVTL